MKVVTRIAPSPTGQMHIGTVRTALFNYLYAKKNGGTYFVRIEDTDKERSKPEWVRAIWDDFEWCGLTHDKSYIQSEHLARHKELLHALVEKDAAYVSKEPSKADPAREVEVVRLRNPGKAVTFNDLIRGEVTFETAELGDFVIARSIDDPLYHFAVVVDDADGGVTHVLRAEEHISNTPRQILIQEALGFPRPEYGHLPLILASDKSKLSKRKHGASVDKYRAEGYLAPAIINYLALLGWNPGTEQEIFSMDQLVQAFDLSQIQKSGAVFDLEKMRWFNRQYMLQMREDDYKDEALRVLEGSVKAKGLPWDENIAHGLVPAIRERISVWEDLREQVRAGEYDFCFIEPVLDVGKIPDKKSTPLEAAKHLAIAAEKISALSNLNEDSVKAALWDYATEVGRGAVLWPLRYALTGRDKSPDPFSVITLIGKEAALRRVNIAIGLLKNT